MQIQPARFDMSSHLRHRSPKGRRAADSARLTPTFMAWRCDQMSLDQNKALIRRFNKEAFEYGDLSATER